MVESNARSSRTPREPTIGMRSSVPEISRKMRTWTVLTAAAITLVVSTAPGTLALWRDVAPVSDLTITTGTLNAAIAPGATTPTTQTTANLGAVTNLLPTENRGLTFTVRNTGTVNLNLAAALTAPTAGNMNLAFGLTPGICPAITPAGTTLTATPALVGGTIAPATNATFCLRVTLTATAPNSLQNTSVGGFTIALTAASTP